MSRQQITVVADDNMPGVEACCAQIAGVDFRVVRRPGRELTAADVAQADWLFVRSITPVTSGLLAATRVRFVGTATIGTDHLDIPWLNQQGMAWSAAPGCNARAVAEWVLTLCLRLAQEQQQHLAGKVLGIVGLGHVGRWVADLMLPLGLRVIAYDPLIATEAWPVHGRVQPVSWAELLATADIITIHTPLTRQGQFPSFHLFNQAALAQMKSSAWLINAARGAVIDHDALLSDLQHNGRVVALDVWEGEPHIRPDVLALVRYASPHIAGHSLEGKWRGTWQIVQAAAAHEGLTLAGSLQDVLPTIGAETLTWPMTGDTEADLHALTAQLVDQAGDDERLRASLHESHPSTAFDALRKHYPVRREFPAHRLQTVSDETSRKLLIALGFCC